MAEGDLVEVEMIGSNGKRIAKGQFRVGQEELASAHRWLELESNPVPDLTRHITTLTPSIQKLGSHIN